MSIKRFVKTTGYLIKKISPKLFLGGGIAGVLASTGFACYKTLDAYDELKKGSEKLAFIEQELHDDEKAYKKAKNKVRTQTVTNIAKIYALPAIGMTLSVTSILNSHRIMENRNTALATSYGSLLTAYNTLKKKAIDSGMSEEDVELNKKEIETEDGKMITAYDLTDETRQFIYDRRIPSCGLNNTNNFDAVCYALRFCNDKLVSDGYLFLSDAFKYLGIDDDMLTKKQLIASKCLGWVYDPYDKNKVNFISFGITDGPTYTPNSLGSKYLRREIYALPLTFNVDGNILDVKSKYHFANFVRTKSEI